MSNDSTLLARRFYRFACVVVAALGSSACNNARSEFIGARVQDVCNGNWPVCNNIVGCILGGQTYAEGAFPQTFDFIVTTAEASNVDVHLYLENVTAAGTQTSITFYETGCTAQVDLAVSGQEMLTESQTQGEFFRQGLLNSIGDHLIEVASDARANYWLKVDITPTRVQ